MSTKRDALAKVARAAAAIEAGKERESTAVQAALAAGATWQEIADALGVTKQTAHRKHGKGAPRPKG